MASTGYVRQSSAGITDTSIIYAALFNNEYNAIVTAFDAANGHTHDGSTGQGGRILALGPAADVTISASALAPKTNLTVDLGTAGLTFRDAFLRSITASGALAVVGNGSIGGTLGVTGAATLTAALTVGGAVTFNNGLFVTGTITATGVMSGGNATTSGHLVNLQTGDARYLQLAGSQTVSGSPVFTNAISVGNASTGAHALNQTTADVRYAQLATANAFLNSLTITATAPSITLSRGSGAVASFIARTGSLNRFAINLADGTAESTGNLGSNFSISRYNDAGTLIDTPLTLTRSTGVLALTQVPTVAGSNVWYSGNFTPGNYLLLTGGTLSGTLTGTRFALDANGYIQLTSSNPVINYDANDYQTYDRTANSLITVINSTVVDTVTGTARTSSVPIVLPADPTSALQATTKQYAEQLVGFRNRLINGDMRWSQRYGAVAQTPAVVSAYILDRWQVYGIQASKLTVQYVTSSLAGSRASQKITVASAATLAASDSFSVQQFIEGNSVGDLMWGTAAASPVAVSFRAKASIAGTYSASLRNAANTRSYIFTFALSAGVDTYVSATIPGDTTGTWDSGSLTGIVLTFDLGAGSTYTGTAGAWTAGNIIHATGSVNFVTNAGATFEFTNVQLEKVPTTTSPATPFEQRPIGLELALCQRYYEGGVSYLGFTSNGVNHVLYAPVSFAATKRAVPTANQAGSSLTNVTSLTVGSTSLASLTLALVSSAVGNCLGVSTWTADAEL